MSSEPVGYAGNAPLAAALQPLSSMLDNSAALFARSVRPLAQDNPTFEGHSTSVAYALNLSSGYSDFRVGAIASPSDSYVFPGSGILQGPGFFGPPHAGPTDGCTASTYADAVSSSVPAASDSTDVTFSTRGIAAPLALPLALPVDVNGLTVVRPLAPRTLLLPAPADVGPSVRVFTRTGFAAAAAAAPAPLSNHSSPASPNRRQGRSESAAAAAALDVSTVDSMDDGGSAPTVDARVSAAAAVDLDSDGTPLRAVKRSRHSHHGRVQASFALPPGPVGALVASAVARAPAGPREERAATDSADEAGTDTDVGAIASGRLRREGTRTISTAQALLLPPEPSLPLPLTARQGSARFWVWCDPGALSWVPGRGRAASNRALTAANVARREGIPYVPHTRVVRESELLQRAAADAPALPAALLSGPSLINTGLGSGTDAGARARAAARSERRLQRYARALAAAGDAPLFAEDAALSAPRSSASVAEAAAQTGPSARLAGYSRDLFRARRRLAARQGGLTFGSDLQLLPPAARVGVDTAVGSGVGDDRSSGSGSGGSSCVSSEADSEGAIVSGSSAEDSDATQGHYARNKSAPRVNPVGALFAELSRSLSAAARVGWRQESLAAATRAALSRVAAVGAGADSGAIGLVSSADDTLIAFVEGETAGDDAGNSGSGHEDTDGEANFSRAGRRSRATEPRLFPLPLPPRHTRAYSEFVASLRLAVERLHRFSSQARLRASRRTLGLLAARFQARDVPPALTSSDTGVAPMLDVNIAAADGQAASWVPTPAEVSSAAKAFAAETVAFNGVVSDSDSDSATATRAQSTQSGTASTTAITSDGGRLTDAEQALLRRGFLRLPAQAQSEAARGHMRPALRADASSAAAAAVAVAASHVAAAGSSASSTSTEVSDSARSTGASSASSCDEADDIVDRLSDRKRRIRQLLRRAMGGSSTSVSRELHRAQVDFLTHWDLGVFVRRPHPWGAPSAPTLITSPADVARKASETRAASNNTTSLVRTMAMAPPDGFARATPWLPWASDLASGEQPVPMVEARPVEPTSRRAAARNARILSGKADDDGQDTQKVLRTALRVDFVSSWRASVDSNTVSSANKARLEDHNAEFDGEDEEDVQLPSPADYASQYSQASAGAGAGAGVDRVSRVPLWSSRHSLKTNALSSLAAPAHAPVLPGYSFLTPNADPEGYPRSRALATYLNDAYAGAIAYAYGGRDGFLRRLGNATAAREYAASLLPPGYVYSAFGCDYPAHTTVTECFAHPSAAATAPALMLDAEAIAGASVPHPAHTESALPVAALSDDPTSMPIALNNELPTRLVSLSSPVAAGSAVEPAQTLSRALGAAVADLVVHGTSTTVAAARAALGAPVPLADGDASGNPAATAAAAAAAAAADSATSSLGAEVASLGGLVLPRSTAPLLLPTRLGDRSSDLELLLYLHQYKDARRAVIAELETYIVAAGIADGVPAAAADAAEKATEQMSVSAVAATASECAGAATELHLVARLWASVEKESRPDFIHQGHSLSLRHSRDSDPLTAFTNAFAGTASDRGTNTSVTDGAVVGGVNADEAPAELNEHAHAIAAAARSLRARADAAHRAEKVWHAASALPLVTTAVAALLPTTTTAADAVAAASSASKVMAPARDSGAAWLRSIAERAAADGALWVLEQLRLVRQRRLMYRAAADAIDALLARARDATAFVDAMASAGADSGVGAGAGASSRLSRETAGLLGAWAAAEPLAENTWPKAPSLQQSRDDSGHHESEHELKATVDSASVVLDSSASAAPDANRDLSTRYSTFLSRTTARYSGARTRALAAAVVPAAATLLDAGARAVGETGSGARAAPATAGIDGSWGAVLRERPHTSMFPGSAASIDVRGGHDACASGSAPSFGGIKSHRRLDYSLVLPTVHLRPMDIFGSISSPAEGLPWRRLGPLDLVAARARGEIDGALRGFSAMEGTAVDVQHRVHALAPASTHSLQLPCLADGEFATTPVHSAGTPNFVAPSAPPRSRAGVASLQSVLRSTCGGVGVCAGDCGDIARCHFGQTVAETLIMPQFALTSAPGRLSTLTAPLPSPWADALADAAAATEPATYAALVLASSYAQFAFPFERWVWQAEALHAARAAAWGSSRFTGTLPLASGEVNASSVRPFGTDSLHDARLMAFLWMGTEPRGLTFGRRGPPNANDAETHWDDWSSAAAAAACAEARASVAAVSATLAAKNLINWSVPHATSRTVWVKHAIPMIARAVAAVCSAAAACETVAAAVTASDGTPALATDAPRTKELKHASSVSAGTLCLGSAASYLASGVLSSSQPPLLPADAIFRRGFLRGPVPTKMTVTRAPPSSGLSPRTHDVPSYFASNGPSTMLLGALDRWNISQVALAKQVWDACEAIAAPAMSPLQNGAYRANPSTDDDDASAPAAAEPATSNKLTLSPSATLAPLFVDPEAPDSAIMGSHHLLWAHASPWVTAGLLGLAFGPSAASVSSTGTGMEEARAAAAPYSAALGRWASLQWPARLTHLPVTTDSVTGSVPETRASLLDGAHVVLPSLAERFFENARVADLVDQRATTYAYVELEPSGRGGLAQRRAATPSDGDYADPLSHSAALRRAKRARARGLEDLRRDRIAVAKLLQQEQCQQQAAASGAPDTDAEMRSGAMVDSFSGASDGDDAAGDARGDTTDDEVLSVQEARARVEARVRRHERNDLPHSRTGFGVPSSAALRPVFTVDDTLAGECLLPTLHTAERANVLAGAGLGARGETPHDDADSALGTRARVRALEIPASLLRRRLAEDVDVTTLQRETNAEYVEAAVAAVAVPAPFAHRWALSEYAKALLIEAATSTNSHADTDDGESIKAKHGSASLEAELSAAAARHLLSLSTATAAEHAALLARGHRGVAASAVKAEPGHTASFAVTAAPSLKFSRSSDVGLAADTWRRWASGSAAVVFHPTGPALRTLAVTLATPPAAGARGGAGAGAGSGGDNFSTETPRAVTLATASARPLRRQIRQISHMSAACGPGGVRLGVFASADSATPEAAAAAASVAARAACGCPDCASASSAACASATGAAFTHGGVAAGFSHGGRSRLQTAASSSGFSSLVLARSRREVLVYEATVAAADAAAEFGAASERLGRAERVGGSDASGRAGSGNSTAATLAVGVLVRDFAAAARELTVMFNGGDMNAGDYTEALAALEADSAADVVAASATGPGYSDARARALLRAALNGDEEGDGAEANVLGKHNVTVPLLRVSASLAPRARLTTGAAVLHAEPHPLWAGEAAVLTIDGRILAWDVEHAASAYAASAAAAEAANAADMATVDADDSDSDYEDGGCSSSRSRAATAAASAVRRLRHVWALSPPVASLRRAAYADDTVAPPCACAAQALVGGAARDCFLCAGLARARRRATRAHAETQPFAGDSLGGPFHGSNGTGILSSGWRERDVVDLWWVPDWARREAVRASVWAATTQTVMAEGGWDSGQDDHDEDGYADENVGDSGGRSYAGSGTTFGEDRRIKRSRRARACPRPAVAPDSVARSTLRRLHTHIPVMRAAFPSWATVKYGAHPRTLLAATPSALYKIDLRAGGAIPAAEADNGLHSGYGAGMNSSKYLRAGAAYSPSFRLPLFLTPSDRRIFALARDPTVPTHVAISTARSVILFDERWAAQPLLRWDLPGVPRPENVWRWNPLTHADKHRPGVAHEAVYQGGGGTGGGGARGKRPASRARTAAEEAFLVASRVRREGMRTNARVRARERAAAQIVRADDEEEEYDPSGRTGADTDAEDLLGVSSGSDDDDDEEDEMGHEPPGEGSSQPVAAAAASIDEHAEVGLMSASTAPPRDTVNAPPMRHLAFVHSRIALPTVRACHGNSFFGPARAFGLPARPPRTLTVSATLAMAAGAADSSSDPELGGGRTENILRAVSALAYSTPVSDVATGIADAVRSPARAAAAAAAASLGLDWASDGDDDGDGAGAGTTDPEGGRNRSFLHASSLKHDKSYLFEYATVAPTATSAASSSGSSALPFAGAQARRVGDFTSPASLRLGADCGASASTVVACGLPLPLHAPPSAAGAVVEHPMRPPRIRETAQTRLDDEEEVAAWTTYTLTVNCDSKRAPAAPSAGVLAADSAAPKKRTGVRAIVHSQIRSSSAGAPATAGAGTEVLTVGGQVLRTVGAVLSAMRDSVRCDASGAGVGACSNASGDGDGDAVAVGDFAGDAVTLIEVASLDPDAPLPGRGHPLHPEAASPQALILAAAAATAAGDAAPASVAPAWASGVPSHGISFPRGLSADVTVDDVSGHGPGASAERRLASTAALTVPERVAAALELLCRVAARARGRPVAEVRAAVADSRLRAAMEGSAAGGDAGDAVDAVLDRWSASAAAAATGAAVAAAASADDVPAQRSAKKTSVGAGRVPWRYLSKEKKIAVMMGAASAFADDDTAAVAGADDSVAGAEAAAGVAGGDPRSRRTPSGADVSESHDARVSRLLADIEGLLELNVRDLDTLIVRAARATLLRPEPPLFIGTAIVATPGLARVPAASVGGVTAATLVVLHCGPKGQLLYQPFALQPVAVLDDEAEDAAASAEGEFENNANGVAAAAAAAAAASSSGARALARETTELAIATAVQEAEVVTAARDADAVADASASEAKIGLAAADAEPPAQFLGSSAPLLPTGELAPTPFGGITAPAAWRLVPKDTGAATSLWADRLGLRNAPTSVDPAGYMTASTAAAPFVAVDTANIHMLLQLPQLFRTGRAAAGHSVRDRERIAREVAGLFVSIDGDTNRVDATAATPTLAEFEAAITAALTRAPPPLELAPTFAPTLASALPHASAGFLSATAAAAAAAPTVLVTADDVLAVMLRHQRTLLPFLRAPRPLAALLRMLFLLVEADAAAGRADAVTAPLAAAFVAAAEAGTGSIGAAGDNIAAAVMSQVSEAAVSAIRACVHFSARIIVHGKKAASAEIETPGSVAAPVVPVPLFAHYSPQPPAVPAACTGPAESSPDSLFGPCRCHRRAGPLDDNALIGLSSASATAPRDAAVAAARRRLLAVLPHDTFPLAVTTGAVVAAATAAPPRGAQALNVDASGIAPAFGGMSAVGSMAVASPVGSAAHTDTGSGASAVASPGHALVARQSNLSSLPAWPMSPPPLSQPSSLLPGDDDGDDLTQNIEYLMSLTADSQSFPPSQLRRGASQYSQFSQTQTLGAIVEDANEEDEDLGAAPYSSEVAASAAAAAADALTSPLSPATHAAPAAAAAGVGSPPAATWQVRQQRELQEVSRAQLLHQHADDPISSEQTADVVAATVAGWGLEAGSAAGVVTAGTRAGTATVGAVLRRGTTVGDRMLAALANLWVEDEGREMAALVLAPTAPAADAESRGVPMADTDRR